MKLLKWLSVCDRFTKVYLDSRLSPLGINSSQHMYLLKICDRPGIAQDDLIDSVYVHPSNVVRSIASLEKNGFVTKGPHDTDRRTCRLYPTPKALEVAEQVRRICDEAEALLTDALSPEEREAFAQALLCAGQKAAQAAGVTRKGDDFDA